ncbi:MAG: hydantoinase/oxoprolinase family protein [Burkholderiales bacterium]|nr:hydantoinase/oxoprolinase family protein [Burkholderiales bacterium]
MSQRKMGPRRSRYRLGVDVGGTHTDLCLFDEGEGTVTTYKVPSTPEDFCRGIAGGICALLAEKGIAPSAVGYLAQGSTVATNAMIQGAGGRIGLLTTAGFRDLLEIRRQNRPLDQLYNFFFERSPVPIPRHRRLEVAERILADGEIWQPLDEAAAARAIDRLVALDVDAIAICLVNAYVDPRHEIRLVEMVKARAPSVEVCASHEVLREFREFERLSTTVINTWLLRPVSQYLERLSHTAAELGIAVPAYVMQGNGGLLSPESAARQPVNLLVSGPSAGVMGAVFCARSAGYRNILTFDMGGTSSDVSIVDGGTPSARTDTELSEYPVRVPMLDIKFIGAGGGSVAWIDQGGALKVGPRSMGADPGPACYGQGGRLATVTDANVVLGYLHPEYLLGGRKKIDREAAREAIERTVAKPLGIDVRRAAHGILTIVNNNMIGALKLVSVERGYDPRDFALLAFGGAGPLHATALARELGIRDVIIPERPGILCALGLLTVDRRFDVVRTAISTLAQTSAGAINAIWADLDSQAMAWLEHEGVPRGQRRVERVVDARYRGQNYELSLAGEPGRWSDATLRQFNQRFHDLHERTYGFHSGHALVQLINFRTIAHGVMPKPVMTRKRKSTGDVGAARIGERKVSWHPARALLATPVYARDKLKAGQSVDGPAILEQMDATTVLAPGERAAVDGYANLIVSFTGARRR